MDEIINRVANSSLVTFDLERLHVPGERVVYDIKDHLFQGLILREKDFREHVKTFNWPGFQDKLVSIVCTADAVVPTWAYMLLAVAMKPYAKRVFFGTVDEMEKELFHEQLALIDWDQYRNVKVVVKGCSDVHVPVSAYVEATSRLIMLASSVMYGEPCSTVPIFKAPKP
ncbi:MAG TPA: DUF2480 family protein [Cyclobacteriaceae bacterium]|nr:DUF2480 family protein [Cyclobacteriaceae bacterium]